MKKFCYRVDLSRIPNILESEILEIEKTGQKQLFENTLNQGLQSLHPQGINGVNAAAYRRLLRSLDDSSDGAMDIEEAEFDLLKSIFKKDGARFMPSQTRLIGLYAERIEEAEGK